MQKSKKLLDIIRDKFVLNIIVFQLKKLMWIG